jgi:hypothetical protein
MREIRWVSDHISSLIHGLGKNDVERVGIAAWIFLM